MKDSENKGKGPTAEGRLEESRDEMALRGHIYFMLMTDLGLLCTYCLKILVM